MSEALIASAAMFRIGRALPLAALLAVVPAALGQNNFVDPRSLAPFVPTPQLVVERMLEAADVTARRYSTQNSCVVKRVSFGVVICHVSSLPYVCWDNASVDATSM